ncbi:MAG: LysM peptidoglycan-binding domain-containing protein [Deltaproteobacteria bacterium]|nr:MAG: LysM peptidoglycan-binding domain-containing protein [Deltaproteobacteria bacterium]
MERTGRWVILFFIWMTLCSLSIAEAEEIIAANLSPLPTGSSAEAEGNCSEGGFSRFLSDEVSIDIPIIINDRVEYFLNYFQTEKRRVFRNWLARSTRYVPRMREILRENGLPEDLVYLAMIESGFNVSAYSPAQASGPWQFIEGTARRYGLEVNFWLDERRDPEKATIAAANYLKDLYQEFGCWYLAAAGYNAGENKVRRGIRTYETVDFWEMCNYDLFARETKDYVPQMIAATIIAKNPEKYGFTAVEYQQPVPCAKVPVPPKTDLKAVALACGVDDQVVKEINPELRRDCTPPGESYLLNIPKSAAQFFKDNFARVKTIVKTCYHRYVVQKGDTLARIAQKFDVSKKTLVSVNKIKGKCSIKKGKALRIPYQVREYALDSKKSKPTAKVASLNDLHKGEKSTGTPRRIYEQKEHTYTVKKGDTLYSVARRFGVSVKALCGQNDLAEDTKLRTGRTLLVDASKYKQDQVVDTPGRVGDAPGRDIIKPKTSKKILAARSGKSKKAYAGKPKARYHRVCRGDTLWNIAQKYNVTPANIRVWNNMQRDTILPGTRIKVRASTTT